MVERTAGGAWREAERELAVRGEYDVLVAGGGLGGVAAALAAARAGARTVLVERNSYLGGVATAGMCCSIFNCYYTGGPQPRLGTTGIAVEVADALAEAAGFGRKWHAHKGHLIYDLEQAKLVLLNLLEQAGVEVLANAYLAEALCDGPRVRGVVIESKAGREALVAETVVDATGDSDVAVRARVPVRTVGAKGLHSLCFRLGNVDVDAFVDYFRANPDQFPEYMDVDWTLAEALAQYDDCGTFLFPHGGGMQMRAFQQARASGDLPAQVGRHDTTDACQMHALRQTGIVHVVTGFVHFDGLDLGELSHSIHDGRRMAFVVADVYRKYLPGFANSYIAGTADNLGVRVSRYPEGDFTFTADMLAPGTRQPDAVGKLVGWETAVKHRGAGAWSAQICHEDTSDLPYRCLVPRGAEGLLMGAGRAVCTDSPWILRTMVQTMVVGQASGAAAALAAAQGVTPRELDVAAVQEELRRQGVDV